MTPIIIMMVTGIMMSITVLIVTRRHDKGTGKISAKDSKKKELALGFDARARCQISPQMAFGQQVREKGRKAEARRARGRDQPASLPLERQAEGRTVGIVDIEIGRASCRESVESAGERVGLNSMRE